MRMKAAVLWDIKKPLTIEEIELAPPKEGEVLVKMVATGVCHSDVHYWTGDVPREKPIILGHEGAGVIQETGPGVTRFKKGDHVVLTFLPSCGKCRWCHQGEPVMCDLGGKLRTGKYLDDTYRHHIVRTNQPASVFLWVSTFAEYSIVPEASLVKAPEWLPLEKLCLLGCGFTTGFGAATNVAKIKPGETVTIIGCGGLGLSAVQGARLSSAGKIIAVDVHPEKLEMAKKFGATHTVLNKHDPQAVIDKILEITWGLGTDYAMEFVGFDQTHETYRIGYGATRKNGTMLFVGVPQVSQKSLPIEARDFALWRKHLVGVLFGDAQFQVDIPRYIQMYEKKQINLDDLVTKEFRLEDINTCFQNIVAGNRVARQVIRFN